MDPSPTRGACQARGEIETGRTREEQQMGDMTAEKKGLFIAIFLIGREIRVLSAFFFQMGVGKGIRLIVSELITQIAAIAILIVVLRVLEPGL